MKMAKTFEFMLHRFCIVDMEALEKCILDDDTIPEN